MGPPTTATSNSNDNRTARDILEGFGGTVHQLARKEAQKVGKNALKGDLSEAKLKDEKKKVTNPCQLNYRYHSNVTSDFDDDNPCYGRVQKRFSDARCGQCTHNRIKDSENNDNSIGACAPYRRLHLCDRNLELINDEEITTHNLLLEVLLAAQHEGQSLVEKHVEHKTSNPHSNICIALARSFADLGDIIRGKDLFLGDKKEKLDLEKKIEKDFCENI